MKSLPEAPKLSDLPDPNPYAGQDGKWRFDDNYQPPKLVFVRAGSTDYSIALMLPGIHQAGSNFYTDEGDQILPES